MTQGRSSERITEGALSRQIDKIGELKEEEEGGCDCEIGMSNRVRQHNCVCLFVCASTKDVTKLRRITTRRQEGR